MKTWTIIKTLAVSFLVAACAQTDFAGDSGQGIRSGKIIPPGTSNGTPGTPGTNNNPSNPVITTDGGGKIEVVDAHLTITRNQDGAKFKNCVRANIVGQAPTELGCNRVSPNGARTPLVSNINIKAKTNTCNVLSLTLTSDSGGGGRVLSSNANIQRFIVKRLGPNNFNVQANDNNDNDWHDLDLTITGDGTVKFTIENSGGCS